MDVMARPVSRSGNYRPEFASAQAIFTDRECFVTFWSDSCKNYPNGKFTIYTTYQKYTHLHPFWRGLDLA